MQPLISPSILAADFAALGAEVSAIDRAGADMIHVDVMDGRFVPQITIGPAVVKALRPHSSKPFDVHLMIAPADPHLEAFAEAGANLLTVHPEAGPHLHRTLQTIRSLGMKAGVAINPGTHENCLEPVLDLVDIVLVMTVNPGYGGQAFLASSLPKIARIRRMLDDAGRGDVVLEVDGGITTETAPKVLAAGANSLVAGTAVFRGGPATYETAITALRRSGGHLA